ncbi:E3 ubiquitin-protein ligase HECTD3 [Biomphalaria glabrata]|uniref:E3 ubiquitin-protein ligase HECTD3-like n=1 Tax=Biomphalaria glabrata TaxID=6526 RepID=A0A9W3AGN2_BIOGL|nr:E3 ubiquitin-protein ligase HECTD3-like [Biomphalaria glabrata]XP_055886454.1 E3 ubiquitin-protein ligase HECTD3-like [Biomphalaria glabrata]XP_055886455.1 E3 ubiquitin-protein ligase HECTD3-like [Biomphalaria glabrata]KAI8754544.1 E3 ubiquitin-protein ligase HECTD3-like [Biomphalaria glabrata]
MHGNYNHNIPSARRRISRIRCLQDCITSLRNRQPFPDCLCYIPSELEYTTSYKTTWKLLQSPDKTSKVIKEIQATPSTRLIVSGEDFCNGDGKWLCVLKTKSTANDDYEHVPGDCLWLLLFSSRSSTEETPSAVPVQEVVSYSKSKLSLLKKQQPKIKSWEGVIEEHYAPVLKKHKAFIVPADKEAVDRLKALEKNWTLEHDAALVQVMSTNIPQETENLGSLRGFVEALGVSSYSSGDGESANLTDDDPNTYWETDGQQGQHWIRLTMKKGTIIKSLSLLVNLADDNYLPETIVVVAGEADDVKVLNSVNIVWSPQSNTEIKLLENLTEHYSIVTIRIKSCKSHGIDTRIRGIKLHCLEERSLGFDQEFFSGEKLVRYPLLQSFSPSVNYRRSVVLQRFMWLLDSVIHYLIPAWQSSIESCHFQEGSTLANLESIRQLLPLSKKRLALIDTLLKGSASDPSDRKIVYINRHAAFEHRVNPSDYNNTVFMQLYEGLKPRDRASTPLTYRWSSQNDQWWECKFISEGIIDQGGGFRDSLSDMAEELCPSDPDAPMALPFFVRTPNQSNEDGNVNRDSYIPNPSCHSLEKYEWLGQLMGACFRGKEILILSLPPYVWKRLAGESYNWSRDFATVDAAEVRLIDSLVNMDRETFLTTGRSWTMVLSDGSHVSLKVDSDGNPLPLAYEDRLEYAEKVREIRLAECDKQLKALRSGLLKVIPEAVLELLTWQELETRICGEPEISVEALMKNTFYHHIDEDDLRVKYFWTAVKNFSNEDRSHLLRFITGRRRLPVSIFISSGKNSPTNPLPESSTCCNTLHLPVYTDEKIAEERLRYAAYNCVSIDTDE